jgi:hypothetical protein
MIVMMIRIDSSTTPAMAVSRKTALILPLRPLVTG